MRTLFINGVFYSPEELKADCLAVCNGQIVDIGARTQLISLKRRGYKVVDLKIIRPFTLIVYPKKSFYKLVEIPLNKKYEKIAKTLCSQLHSS